MQRTVRFAVAVRKLFLVGLLAQFASAQSAFNPRDTSVQLFKWSWNNVAKECHDWLGLQGYGAVQISPPGASKRANGWWDMYQPVNYGNLTSRMGTASDLQNMIDTCHAAGVRVYADIVVNQMADQSSAADGAATDGSSWDAGVLNYPQFSSSDFHNNTTPGECTNSDDNIAQSDFGTPGNRNNVIFCRVGGLPDLASESSHVQGVVVAYLNQLLSMGVDGFRIDAAKHQQPSALQSILNQVKTTHPQTTSGESIWVTQEVIPDGNVVRSDYFPTGTVNEFQFTFAMQQIFRNSNGLNLSSIPTVMGTPGNWGGTFGFVQPQNAVVFVNNWDTERNGSSLNASNLTGATNDTQGTKRYDLASIFMLAGPYGEAQVQSGFRFTDANQDAPVASPYDANGNALINVDWDFIHRWADISNMVKFRSATSGQGMINFVTGSGNQVAFSRGNTGFVAINNDTSTWNNSFQTGLPAGTYCNIIHGLLNSGGTGCTGDSITVDANGNANLSIPANGGATVPAVAIYKGQMVGGSPGCQIGMFCPSKTPVDFDPSLLVQGKSIVIYYDGTLASGATVNMHYGFNNWAGGTITDVAMSKRSDGFFQSPPIALSSSTTEFDFVFNNGSGTWDNNNGKNYILAVPSSGGGGGGSCNTVGVTFTIANANTTFGQNLYVAGNQASLGNWAPASAFPLTIQGTGANATWSGTMLLPPGTAIQYKYIKFDPSTGAVVWENNQNTNSGNRQATTATCGGSSTFNDGSF